ncbi:ISCU [Cervus elaphus hippelaphus]|uniref:ISCU n=1 Tax=Cervus elaphus hippelaphus TaxID=46360 RepID=A0A212D9J2_CEREH|nr:ISCU [Cervus elaphus hippelaphus]
MACQVQLADLKELAIKVVDHYENPRNVGSLDKTSKNVGTGLIQVDEKGKIVDARFKTFGCGSAIASSSLATEWVKGKTYHSHQHDTIIIRINITTTTNSIIIIVITSINTIITPSASVSSSVSRN